MAQYGNYDRATLLKSNGSLDTVKGNMSGYNGQYLTIYRSNGLLYVMTSRSGETFSMDRGVLVSKLSKGRLIQLARALGEDLEGEDALSQLFRKHSKLQASDTDTLRSAIISRCENNSDVQAGSFWQKSMVE